jgi:putative hydrolase of the HAD superfamily
MTEVRKQVFAEFPEQGHDYTFLRRTVLGRLGEAAEYGQHLVDEAMEVFDTERNTVDIFPEVRPALERLRRRYVLVAVTNGNACLERIGIHDLFDHFVSARIAGAAKPSKKIFKVAVSAGGAAPHQTLHVGDHPEFDVQGARDAGLRAVWVNRNDSEWPDELSQPDGVVNHVGELAALLDAAMQ